MQIKTVSITRKDAYTKEGPEYSGSITLVGGRSWEPEIKVQIPEHQLLPILDIMAQASLAVFTDALETYKSEVAAAISGPAIDQVAITDQVEPA
jgi:hypothetical protein